MNPLTQFKKTLILPLFIALAIVALAAPARATPGCGITIQDLSVGPFPAGSLNLMCIDGRAWNLITRVKGDSDVLVTQYTFAPGGHTGWHSHPGPSLVTVVSGELTVYEGNDPTCTPTIHHAGEAFTDVGCGDTHLARNAGNVPTVLMVVHILPAGQPRRIDQPDPGNCAPFMCP